MTWDVRYVRPDNGHLENLQMPNEQWALGVALGALVRLDLREIRIERGGHVVVDRDQLIAEAGARGLLPPKLKVQGSFGGSFRFSLEGLSKQ